MMFLLRHPLRTLRTLESSLYRTYNLTIALSLCKHVGKPLWDLDDNITSSGVGKIFYSAFRKAWVVLFGYSTEGSRVRTTLSLFSVQLLRSLSSKCYSSYSDSL